MPICRPTSHLELEADTPPPRPHLPALNHRTLSNLNRRLAKDGSESDSDEPNEYYTGGEKSQQTRFKAFVIVGNSNVDVGLDVKCSKEVTTTIRGVIILAKLSAIPMRTNYWGNKTGKPKVALYLIVLNRKLGFKW
ncbi:hypothetical protein M0R45_030681 [Rubus argutus]|uniref:S5 DRBM domain-containing protein n=1 Tax=Rubus argutus TaxID=59490 RepID=A0AAW1WDY1_RUBAR